MNYEVGDIIKTISLESILMITKVLDYEYEVQYLQYPTQEKVKFNKYYMHEYSLLVQKGKR